MRVTGRVIAGDPESMFIDNTDIKASVCAKWLAALSRQQRRQWEREAAKPKHGVHWLYRNLAYQRTLAKARA